MTETEFRVARIFRDAVGIEVASSTVDVVESGLLDSLGLVMLLVELEREFAVTIPLDLDIESLRTVERLATLVEHVAEEGSA